MNRFLIAASIIWSLSVYAILLTQSESAQPPQPDWAYKPFDGPYAVRAVPTIILHDAKRGKDLQLRMTYPDGKGSFPIIIWSHGATATKDLYQPLIRYWASHGYVCIQPNHSDSVALTGRARLTPDTLRDWESRPQDIRFILDSLDALEAKVPELKGKLNRKAIGVGGHSFGAHTTQLLAGATTINNGERKSHGDKRPTAFLLISPQGIGRQMGGLDAQSWETLTRPFLLITGTNDRGLTGESWEWRLDPYKYARSKEKYLLVIEGAWHGFGGITGLRGGAFRNAGAENPTHRMYVKTASLAFWDAYLKNDPTAKRFLQSDTMTRHTNGQAKLESGR
ncbi:MAG: hypothetical protein KatS3mg019_1816 [Fimbriimonadales bacterium]|nr:MAG: hypothetical protein KatS3mg019_1816 [Fimbriimonadales bacterium]